MVERDVRHAPPDVSATADLTPALGRQAKPYRPPTLTVYGSVRDLTRGTGQGAPDNGVTASHFYMGPPGHASR